MSIVTELGPRYFEQRFAGAYFRGPDNKICMVDTASREVRRDNAVPVIVIGGPIERVNSENITLPDTFFTDMAQFAVPRLGWRSAQNGRFMTYLTRNNQSYQRGVCKKNLEFQDAPHTSFLCQYASISREYYQRPVTLGKMVLDPQYMPLARGLADMNAGRRAGFCLNPDIAVVPFSEDKYALLGMAGMVGTVECATGTIEMSIPLTAEQLELS